MRPQGPKLVVIGIRVEFERGLPHARFRWSD